MSKSMENFYQESGRAGRDNQIAKCILLYKFSDISRLSTMVFTEQTGLEKLYGIVSYCLNNSRWVSHSDFTTELCSKKLSKFEVEAWLC